jgi:hypothetical protein
MDFFVVFAERKVEVFCDYSLVLKGWTEVEAKQCECFISDNWSNVFGEENASASYSL